MGELLPTSRALDDAIRHAIDTKTKPIGALGVVETLAAQVARIQGTLTPRLDRCRLTLFAGDHGIADEGVSAYPQAVTRQMVANFLAGGAAANVFARANGVDLQVVDAGVAGDPMDAPGLVARRIAGGTRNFAVEPAMTAEQCHAALGAGEALGGEIAADAAAFGEMGIANTSAATLIAHKLTGAALDALIGRGTGLDDDGLARKGAVLGRAAARTADRLDARAALREYGGFEIVMMAGAMIGVGARRGGCPRGRIHRERGGARGGRGSRRRCATTWSSRTAPPSRATARCWMHSTPGRCSISTCASARAPGR